MHVLPTLFQVTSKVAVTKGSHTYYIHALGHFLLHITLRVSFPNGDADRSAQVLAGHTKSSFSFKQTFSHVIANLSSE